jgi:response regulator RpfG family c-di-GMP phosphodiesterase/serine/threonine protein kinase
MLGQRAGLLPEIRTKTMATVSIQFDDARTRVDSSRPVAPAAACPSLSAEARALLETVSRLGLLAPGSAERFFSNHADRLAEYATASRFGQALVQAGLLTQYQLDRVLAGTTHGLVLGSHRILNRLGSGAMGVVFLAEHVLLRRRAAVKVMPVDEDCPPSLLERFYAEMRVLADLHHPNIVLAFDAGQLAAAGPGMPPLLYLVMELVSGGDLEQQVRDHGRVPVAQACEWVRQAASGLQEAHDRHLIHRDVKPSNLLLTEQGQVKVMDFGLARKFCSRLTDPRALLGTLEFMAPEQSCDASMVDGRADIYGLGATLFYLLTGELPYPRARSIAEALRMLQRDRPRQLRALRPEVPEELEVLVDRMLDRDPNRRPALPIAVMNALLPHSSVVSARPVAVRRAGPEVHREAARGPVVRTSTPRPPALSNRVLIVDDEEPIRTLAKAVLEPRGCVCDEAGDAAGALAAVQRQPYDLLLLDLNLPDQSGYEVCRTLRERPVQPHCKIIVVSGQGDHNALAATLPLGADDYIPKPFGVQQLEARVLHALQLKRAQEQADFIARQLALTNTQLENSLAARTFDVRRAQDALLFAMAKMAESRDGETPGHLRRLQRYARCLAEHVADKPAWAGVVNGTFLEYLERCVPLHDIGKIGLPEQVLLKPGKLTVAERALMETHTLIGDRILEELGREHGESLAFLGTASAIVRHHHERYDGSGYPDRLAGDAIPAAARLVAPADVYDALRRRRLHKPALAHAEAVRILREGSGSQFEPAVMEAFAACERQFERIYREIPM